jgi:hypothetical protein
MRHSQGITVQRAILHLVDPKTEGGYVLSERELPLKSQAEFAAYLADHVEESLHDPAARAASFDRTKLDAALLPICTGLLVGRAPFVKGSCDIASHLHTLISNDKRISSGTLAVCSYTAKSLPDAGRFLAILKLDPSQGFQHAVASDRKGHRYVTVKRIDNAVPSAGKRLQKCAFIRHVADHDATYDMVILDSQKRGSLEPAQFFTTDFLAARLYADPETLTRTFYLQAVAALNEIRHDLGPVKAERVKKAIDNAVHAEHVNIEEWVEGLRINQAAKAHMKTRIVPAIPDAVFSTDEAIAEKLTRKRVLKGAYGLKISVNAPQFDQVIVKQTKREGYTELVIHATDLQEVLR